MIIKISFNISLKDFNFIEKEIFYYLPIYFRYKRIHKFTKILASSTEVMLILLILHVVFFLALFSFTENLYNKYYFM